MESETRHRIATAPAGVRVRYGRTARNVSFEIGAAGAS
jgi:hypothetical protein